MIVNGTPGNITQIPNRSHSDLQNLTNNDHPWYSAEPNRLALSSFTEGLDASKSATPSVGNVYYATDTKKIYICFATNTWTQVDDVAVPHGAAQGDTIYFDGAKWNRLAAGTAGNVLTTQGAGANPSWTAAGLASTATATGIMVPSTTGSFSVTGLSFQPSMVIIEQMVSGHGVSGAAWSWSKGIKIGSNAVSTLWAEWDTNNQFNNGTSSTNIINLTANQAITATTATFTSFNSDGFTIDISALGSTVNLFYIANK